MLKKYTKEMIVVFNCLIISFMTYVLVEGAGYTVLIGDDFVHGVQVGAFHVSFFQYFVASLNYMKEMYMTWQGTYFAMFIQAFLSPINNFGLTQLKIVMIVNALLLVLSLLGVIWTAFNFVHQGRKMLYVWLTISSIVLFSILDARVFSEIFFWFSGAVAYSIPLSFLLISIIFFLRANTNHEGKDKKWCKTVCFIMSAIFLFLSSGGSLAIAGAGCYIILLLSLGLYLNSRKISLSNIIVTAIGIAGAGINAIAPGNFARHTETTGEGLLLFQAVKWAIKNVVAEMGRLTKETMFGVMIVAMVVAGIYFFSKLKIDLRYYGIISILALLTGFITAFPVALGYGGSYFPNRCYFVLDVVLVLSLLNFAFFIGCCLENWADLSKNKSAYAILMIVLVSDFFFCRESLSDSSLMVMAESTHNGTYRDYYNECVAVYDYLENCPEDKVVLKMPAYIDNFECFYFDEDETSWVNVGLAQYYHKESVKRKNE